MLAESIDLKTNQSCKHDDNDLQALFYKCFFNTYNTRLVGGFDEPYYLPAKVDLDSTTTYAAEVQYSHDYFASALHEIAHWCIAGKARRKLADYGYWYAPDGRNEAQQLAFQQVEVKPQALEKAFSIACNKAFRVSSDNLNGSFQNDTEFSQAVDLQLELYMKDGFPKRAALFLACLHDFYQSPFLSQQIKDLASFKPCTVAV